MKLLILLLFLIGCATTPSVDFKDVGKRVDDLCVAGRVSNNAARLFNQNSGMWASKHDDYTWPVAEGDRVVNRRCSECLKSITQSSGEISEECAWFLEQWSNQ